jgi:hypothetical protein
MPPPIEEYRKRLDVLTGERSRLQRADRFYIGAKLLVGLVTILLAVWLVKYHAAQLAYLLIPVALLMAFFVIHERLLKGLRRNTNLRLMYDAGLARLEDRWAGQGETGERYLQAATGSLIHPDPGSHPYARDLDLFGGGSVYQLLCTARTRVGQDVLAGWLLGAAQVEEIYQRQEAVQELAPLLDFRERIAIAASATEAKRKPLTLVDSSANPLIAWSESSDLLSRKLRWPELLLALLWVASIVAWQLYGLGLPAVVMSALNALLVYRYRAEVRETVAAVEAASHDLPLLAALFAAIEHQDFSSEKLKKLQSRLRESGAVPSKTLAQLNARSEWLFSNDNWFVKILAPFIFWNHQCIFALEDWRAVHGASVRGWLAVIGEMEALLSLSVYSYEHPEDVFPEFTEDAPVFEAEEFSHPLLPRGRAVPNSLRLDRNLQLVMISGPNMAGKSTFIRSIGVNVVLAQAGAPVRARSLRLSLLTVAASICILDSLQGGLSRFYAEIMRLKHIDTLSRASPPVLFLLDELLSGTNSHDRRAGTESMVRSLVSRGAIGLVTTHDLALAEIATTMGSHAANFHFEDRYENGELHFEYRLSPGIVQTSNALQLMRSIGLEV